MLHAPRQAMASGSGQTKTRHWVVAQIDGCGGSFLNGRFAVARHCGLGRASPVRGGSSRLNGLLGGDLEGPKQAIRHEVHVSCMYMASRGQADGTKSFIHSASQGGRTERVQCGFFSIVCFVHRYIHMYKDGGPHEYVPMHACILTMATVTITQIGSIQGTISTEDDAAYSP